MRGMLDLIRRGADLKRNRLEKGEYTLSALSFEYPGNTCISQGQIVICGSQSMCAPSMFSKSGFVGRRH